MPAKKGGNKELPKAYDASRVEDDLYARWEASGFFNPDRLPGGKKKKPFVIMMPPPNATGVLHVGHAIMLALEDLMIRYKRMRGFASLWLPGTDHASIATQAKVERLIHEKEGKSRHDLGREAFLKRVEAFVEDSRGTIRRQIRKMGSSCDWSREAFTLDAARSRAVVEMFNRMHEDGLVYRGERVVNWCVRCTSTLADDEVEYKAQKAKLYFLKYGPFTVATTRPETKLGDVAVAANPGDERYQKWLGKSFELDWGPGTKKLAIRVIGDHEVDPKFGSGLVGVTPAHSAVDFRMAQKNKLPLIKVIGEDGRMTEAAGKYKGMTVLEARHAFVKDLEARGLVVRVEEIDNNLSGCYRCGTAIEPLTSLQWFVDVNRKIPKRGKSLKELSLEAVRSGSVKIIPERFEKTYFRWMENLRDWCISRQIWYGHRIPVWYCGNAHVTVARKTPLVCGTKDCGSSKLRQDEDTFDTWFSSGTWTFSTLGWPKKTPDLARFHPTDVLETGYDILFFWVARMILMTTYAMGEAPFRHAYLHGLVRDEQGRKMSKSLGNVIDPLDVILKYGTDAVRLSLILGTAPGADAKIWDEKIAGFRNFTNKLWNISRFVLTSVTKPARVPKRPAPKTLADRWILARLDATAAAVTRRLESFEFSAAGELLRDFTWTELADWYLEIAKIQLQDAKLRATTEKVLLHVLETVLKLWHPYMPFVTEAVWDLLAGNANGKKFLMIEDWPKVRSTPAKDGVQRLKDFDLIRDVISAIRNVRAEYKVEPGRKIDATVVAGAKAKLLTENAELIRALARVGWLAIAAKGEKPKGAATAMAGGIAVHLPLAGLVDKEKEKARLGKELAALSGFVTSLEAKLANPGYAGKAPKEIVEKTRQMLADKKKELAKIEEGLKALGA